MERSISEDVDSTRRSKRRTNWVCTKVDSIENKVYINKNDFVTLLYLTVIFLLVIKLIRIFIYPQ